MIKWYKPRKVFWLIRCNVYWDMGLEILEITFGLFGYGILVNWRKTPEWMK